MARYSAGQRSTSAGSTALPIGSVYSSASVGGTLREVGVFNTTTTACAVMLARLTSTGTQGSALTETAHSLNAPTASLTAVGAHSAGTPVGSDLGYRATLGAAAGAGVIWTFGAEGLQINAGTTNGIGIVVATGTGQICDFYFCWDE